MSAAKALPEPKNAQPQPEEARQKKDKPAKKAKNKKTRNQPVSLPLLVEVGFTFSGIFLVLVDGIVAYISFVSGAAWTDIFFRVVVSTVVIGIILWLLSMNLSNGALAAALKHIEEEEEEQAKKAAKAAGELEPGSNLETAVEA